MSDDKARRAPRAFSVDPDPTPGPAAKETERPRPREPRAISEPARIIVDEDDYFAREHLDELDVPLPKPSPGRRRGLRLGAVAAAALGVVVSLALGLWFEGLVRDLFARNPVLGQVALAAIGVFVIALLALVIREFLAIARFSSINDLRQKITTAIEDGNDRDLNAATDRLKAHLARHPKTAAGRARLAELDGEVIDAEDRFGLVETELLKRLDAEARTLVINAAKRVSVVTAVSPRALIDIGYVLYENIRLMRVIAEHYGGRTSALGTLALVRRVVAHLAVTGTMALGDGLLQQVLGHGIAARLSARLGEGVVNGLMTARIGLAAIDVCRPAPFIALPRPKLGDFAAILTRVTGAAKQTKSADG